MNYEQIAEELGGILDKYQMPRFKPVGWSDADIERVADWVEPMRGEIERIKNAITTTEALTQCNHPDCRTWRSKPCSEGCYWQPPAAATLTREKDE